MVKDGNIGIKTGKDFYEYGEYPAYLSSVRSAKILKLKQAVDKTLAEFE